MIRSVMLVAGVLLAGAAQDEDEPLCGGCDTTGRTANKLRASASKDEADVIYCSEAMRRDKTAFAAEEVICPKCKGTSYHESAKQEIEGEIAKRRQWLADREEKVDKPAGGACVHIKTTHFNLSFDIESVKIGPVVHKTHAAAHLYAERLEKLYSDILELHGITDRNVNPTKRFVFIVDTDRAASAIAAAHEMSPGARVSLYGNPSHMVVALDKKTFREDIEFHQHVAHTASHHIYNDVDTFQHWLGQRYGWVCEGLAHFIEMRYFGTPNTWCNQESPGFVNWVGKNWESNVLKSLQAGTAPVFEDLQQKPADALSAKEHQFAWSYIDYLVWLDPKALPKMLGYMKGPQLPVRECLQKAYGLSLPAFVAGWEEFVRTQYSTIPKKGPQPRAPKGAEPVTPDKDGGDGADSEDDEDDEDGR